jgi:hypothetical protein
MPREALKAINVELALKGGKLNLREPSEKETTLGTICKSLNTSRNLLSVMRHLLWQNSCNKLFLLMNNTASTVWLPRNKIVQAIAFKLAD